MPTKEVTFDSEMEEVYRRYLSFKGSEIPIAEIILGDPAYGRRARMPKWNVEVTMLQEPRVALRYWHSWGIPTSREAHRQRAEYFGQLHAEYERTYQDLVNYALETYGSQGSLISGVVRDHFPVHVKNRLRFLATAKTMTSEARQLHAFLSKTRSPAFA